MRTIKDIPSNILFDDSGDQYIRTKDLNELVMGWYKELMETIFEDGEYQYDNYRFRDEAAIIDFIEDVFDLTEDDLKW